MSENPPQDESLADEFRSLGKNLADAVQAAWDSPERKRLVQEVETNLVELSDAMKREVEYFSDSPTAQRLKNDIEELGERVRGSETQDRIRQEVIKILQNANSELQKVIDRWSPQSTGTKNSTAPDEPVELREKDD